MPILGNGIEKRYINGKEIVINHSDPLKIQKKINSKETDNITGDMNDLKNSFNPDTDYGAIADAYGKDTFTDISEKYKNNEVEQSKQRFYQIYREMLSQVFIINSLNMIKNEATQKNDENNLIKTISDNQDIIDDSNELFFDILDINYELKSIVFETCQMGDNYYEIILDNYEKPSSIIHLEYLLPERITIFYKDGRLKFYLYSEEEVYDGVGGARQYNIDPLQFLSMKERENKKFKIFMPWQIVHFKIKDRQSFPYGKSLLKSGIKDYRRLALLEDSMLVYRISRAPERRVFYIPVGMLNNFDAKQFVNKIKNTFKKEPIVDENGNLSERMNAMGLMEDFYIPVANGQVGTKIESLAGGQQLSEIKDIEYFKDKILRLLNIPISYLGGTSAADNINPQKNSLSNIDIKFANYIEEIQSFIIKGLNKILALQLFIKNYDNSDIINFKIELTPPSNLKELIDLDYLTQQVNVSAALKGLQMFSDEYIYKKIFKLSSKEIYQEQIKLAAQMQKIQSQPQQPQQQGVISQQNQSQQNIPSDNIVTPPGPQVSSTNNNYIYNLGLKALNENYELFALDNLAKKIGNGFLFEERQDISKFINEFRTIKEILENKEKKKSKIKNDFSSLVKLGEFEGISLKNKTIGFYKKNKKNTINLFNNIKEII